MTEQIETKAFQQFTGNVEPIKTLITWAVNQGLPLALAKEIAQKANSEKNLANLLRQAIDAMQNPIEVRSEDIDPGELLSEDF